MKILHVCPLYYPSIGGNQNHIQIVSEKLVTLGHEVHVFTANALIQQQHPPDNKFLLKQEIIGGVRVHRFKNNFGLQGFIPDRMIKIKGGYRLFKIMFGNSEAYWKQGPILPDMLLAIYRLKPDIIMASNNVFYTTYLCGLARRYFSIPLVIMPVLHICDKSNNSPNRIDSLQEADHLIAHTNFEKDLLLKMDIPESNIDILPLGLPVSSGVLSNKNGLIRKKFGIPHGPLVAYVGRKVTHKGIESLIDAMRMVWKSSPNCRLIIAGKSNEDFVPTLQKHFGQYTEKEQRKIINIDNLTKEEISLIYSEIDVLAMPSTSDCFGLVYLEAWQHAKPVIACRNTPQEDIITDGHDGFLVDYGNSMELAQAILKVVQNSDLRNRMGQNGRKSLESKFNIEHYTKNLYASYLAVTNKFLLRKPDPYLKYLSKKLFHTFLSQLSPEWGHQYQSQNQFNQNKRKESKLLWQALSPGPDRRLDAAGVQIGEKLFVFGGLLYNGKVLSVVDVLNLKLRKWIERIDMPAEMPQSHIGMIGDGQRYIYTVSGQLGGNCRPPSPACFIFDTWDKVWIKLPNLPQARYACTVQIWNGRLHAIGGSKEDRYTPAFDHWSIAVKDGRAMEYHWQIEPSIPRGGPHRASAIFNNSLFVFGGQEGDYMAVPNDPEFQCTDNLTNETVFPDTYRLEKGSRQWQKMAPMPVPVSHTEYTVIQHDSKILLLGGQIKKNPKSKKIQISDGIQAYFPFEDRWEIIGSLPYRTKAVVTAFYDGYIYFTSGQRDKGPYNSLPAKEFDHSLWRAKL